jgi:hypothetical protein
VPEHPGDLEVALSEMLGLDPDLAEEVSVACRGGNTTHVAEAVVRLFLAANKELEYPW